MSAASTPFSADHTSGWPHDGQLAGLVAAGAAADVVEAPAPLEDRHAGAGLALEEVLQPAAQVLVLGVARGVHAHPLEVELDSETGSVFTLHEDRGQRGPVAARVTGTLVPPQLKVPVIDEHMDASAAITTSSHDHSHAACAGTTAHAFPACQRSTGWRAARTSSRRRTGVA